MSRRDVVASLAESEAPGASGFVRVHCPWCEELGHFSSVKNLAINPETGWFRCWRQFHCGTVGWLWDRDEQVYSEAYAPVTHIKVKPLGKDTRRLPDDIEEFVPLDPTQKGPQLPYLNYLRKRRVHPSVITECGIGYSKHFKWAGRVIIPLTRLNGVAGYYGAVTRTLVGKEYKNTPALHRDALFNEAALWEDAPEPLAIVEGVFDALPHYPYATAVLGKPTDAQVDILARSKRDLVIMLDADARAEASSTKVRLRLRGKEVRVAYLEPGMDPGDMTIDQFADLLFKDTQ